MVLLLGAMLSGCSIYDYGSDTTDMTSSKVELGIAVSLTDGAPLLGVQSRGVLAEAVTDGEKMQTLRIIIVRADGTVEHNRYYDFHQVPSTIFRSEKFEVEGGETKQVYLFANENTTFSTGYRVADYDFSTIKQGTPFPTGEVEQLLIEVNDATTQIASPLFMSECHTVVMPKADKDVELIILRAAVKFTFSFVNQGAENMVLEQLVISKLARHEYLLPRGVVYGDESSEEDGSQVQYIVSYQVPMVGNNEHYDFRADLGRQIVSAYGTTTLAPIYLLESNYDDQPDVAGRNYKIALTVDGETYEDGFFDNLSSLPRNTHVVVEVKLNTTLKAMDCSVRVYPYGEYWLYPEFGQ